MGLGTLYGVGDTVGLRTPLWGWGRRYGAEDTLCGAVLYTGLYWSILGGAAPPPPGGALSSSFRPPKGKWEEMGGGGGANFGVKSPLFGAFWAPTLGRKAAIWGQKSPIGGKKRSFFGVRTPHLGQKL